MKFSEAIRLGAMIRPQAFFTLFDLETQSSCALGAAAEAIGVLDLTAQNRFIENAKTLVPREWKWAKQTVECPECGTDWVSECFLGSDVQGVLVHLNNDHRWTRERIADWVALLEEAHESAQSSAAVDPIADSEGTPPTRVKSSSFSSRASRTET